MHAGEPSSRETKAGRSWRPAWVSQKTKTWVLIKHPCAKLRLTFEILGSWSIISAGLSTITKEPANIYLSSLDFALTRLHVGRGERRASLTQTKRGSAWDFQNSFTCIPFARISKEDLRAQRVNRTQCINSTILEIQLKHWMLKIVPFKAKTAINNKIRKKKKMNSPGNI
jgi:hypothetical protein